MNNRHNTRAAAPFRHDLWANELICPPSTLINIAKISVLGQFSTMNSQLRAPFSTHELCKKACRSRGGLLRKPISSTLTFRKTANHINNQKNQIRNYFHCCTDGLNRWKDNNILLKNVIKSFNKVQLMISVLVLRMD